MIFSQKKNTEGMAMVEVIVGVAVFLVVTLSATIAFSLALRLSLANTSKVQALYLEEEGIEIARIFRDNGWTGNVAGLTVGTDYFLRWNGTTWATSTANTFVDGTFERKIRFDSVRRDGSYNIVSSGGSVDADTRKVTITVSWQNAGATTTQALSTYITNVFRN